MRAGSDDNALTRAIARLRRHRYGGLVEALIEEPSFLAKSMFGGMACYLHGRMMLILTDRRPPWRGLLVLTARADQVSLCAELPALAPHPIIGKWLFLPDAAPELEETAAGLVTLILADDPRLGVESTPRPPRRRTQARPAAPTRRRAPRAR
jgi:hypothetical protein